MTINRRDALKLTAGACLTGATHLLGAGSGTKNKRIPIGIQLYAVRGAFSKDPAGTLKGLAKAGYQGVEFWGYGGGPAVFKGKSADEFRKILDDLGIKCCGMHLNPNTIVGDQLKQTIEINKKLGNKFLIVAAASKQMSSPAAIKQFAQTLNDAAARAKKLDMRVGYHCHPFDFAKFDGTTAWDLLFSQTRPEVVMQLDIGNCAGGGGDPLAILKKFPGRATTLHIKDYAKAPLKKGDPIWQEIFTLCEKTHKTEWYIVEMGESGGNSLDVSKQALQTLRAMGK